MHCPYCGRWCPKINGYSDCPSCKWHEKHGKKHDTQPTPVVVIEELPVTYEPPALPKKKKKDE